MTDEEKDEDPNEDEDEMADEDEMTDEDEMADEDELGGVVDTVDELVELSVGSELEDEVSGGIEEEGDSGPAVVVELTLLVVETSDWPRTGLTRRMAVTKGRYRIFIVILDYDCVKRVLCLCNEEKVTLGAARGVYINGYLPFLMTIVEHV